MLLLTLILGSFHHQSFGQTLEESIISIDNESDENNLEEYLTNRQALIENPINLNKTDQAELELSGLFDASQINSLLRHLEQNGSLISLYELQAIPYFNLDFIHSILPFIQINNSIDEYYLKFSKLISKGTYQFFIRYNQSFPKKNGYKQNKYLGNPSNIFSRLKYNYSNKFYYGISMEKDAGEPMFKKNNKQGFDFYTFHIFWRKNAKLQALALGDYHVNFGQGLVIWTGFGFSKSGNASNIKKEGSGLKPFSSISESLFLRGAAITLAWKRLEFTSFISYKAIDANLNYIDSTNILESTSLQASGYHRTSNEVASKHTVKELTTGFNLQYKTRSYHFGVNFLNTYYDQNLIFKKQIYNQHQFNGKTLTNISLDYHILIKSFHFFGEQALSFAQQSIGFAILNGLIFNPDSKIDMAILHRYYAPNFQASTYANAFGESSKANSEHGLYLSLALQIHKHLSLSTYFDIYQFPWLKYGIDKVAKGNDFSFQIKYKPSKILEAYIAYKREEKESNTSIALGENDAVLITQNNRKYFQAYFDQENFSPYSNTLRPSKQLSKQDIEAATFITPILHQKLRLHLSYKPHKSWTLQSRVEFSFYNDKINSKQTGFLLFQDVKFKKMASPFSFSARVILFDISQYDSRIYAYENDVLNQFSIPALYNAGFRYYLNMQYQINEHLDIWIKYANTIYSNISSKGSGNDEIASNKIYDIKMQLRLKF